ncbi:MAG: dephospho-CoA kinase, partial [Pseudomonadota bacterium]
MTDIAPGLSMRIGLTGGIASGKTTVANMFADLGIDLVDTDIIAREVVEPGQPAYAEVRDRFGDRVIDRAGELDRRALRAVVFADADKRRQLEAILHPRIRA